MDPRCYVISDIVAEEFKPAARLIEHRMAFIKQLLDIYRDMKSIGMRTAFLIKLPPLLNLMLETCGKDLKLVSVGKYGRKESVNTIIQFENAALMTNITNLEDHFKKDHTDLKSVMEKHQQKIAGQLNAHTNSSVVTAVDRAASPSGVSENRARLYSRSNSRPAASPSHSHSAPSLLKG